MNNSTILSFTAWSLLFLASASAQTKAPPPAVPPKPAVKPAPAARPAKSPDVVMNAERGKVKSFYGEYKETGVLKDGEVLTTRIWYRHPDNYTFQYTAPERFKGSGGSFDRRALRIFYPALGFGVIYRHVPALGGIFKDENRLDKKAYSYKFGKYSMVAKMPTVEVEATPLKSGSKIESRSWKIYEPYSFTLETNIDFNGPGKYSREYTTIDLNNDKAYPTRPVIAAKPYMMVVEWDLSSRGLREKEIRESVDFKFQVPKAMPGGVRLAKIIRQKAKAPVFGAIYTGGGNILIMIFHKETVDTSLPEGWGIEMFSPVHRKAMMVPGIINSYWFAYEGTRYFLMSTLPMEDVIEAAHMIGPPPAKAETPAPPKKGS